MLFHLKHFGKLTDQIMRKVEPQLFLNKKTSVKSVICYFLGVNNERSFHMSSPRNKKMKMSYEVTRASNLAFKAANAPLVGEDSIEIDNAVRDENSIFPTFDLPDKLFGGIPFKNLPIVHIKATKNNTILELTENGVPKILRSCGLEGFKNAKKGTNIAAQTAGTSLGLRAVKYGYKNVRVVLKGLGSGRLSALKGLQLGGVEIISITDNTLDFTTMRPRKAKRL